MLARIMVPLDGSPLAERALPYAIALAKAGEGRLVLVRVTTAPALSNQPIAESDAAAYLHVTAEAAEQTGVSVEAHVYHRYLENIAQTLVNASHAHGATMVAMSSHGRGGIERLLYGSVADRFLQLADVPVLVVAAATERRWPLDHAPRVLVPLDGSALAEEALVPAAELASALQSRLLLLQVVEPPRYGYAEGYAYPEFDLDDALATSRQYLETQAERMRQQGADVETAVEVGGASSTIATVAHKRDIDLVVMTTHGHGGLARLVLGSVATGTLQRARVPILLARPAVMVQPAEEAAPAQTS